MCVCVRACAHILVAQLCRTLYDPMVCSLPGSSVHGILQARILEWVAIPFSRGSSRLRDWTQICTLWADCLSSELSGKPYPHLSSCSNQTGSSRPLTSPIDSLQHQCSGNFLSKISQIGLHLSCCHQSNLVSLYMIWALPSILHFAAKTVFLKASKTILFT